MIDLKLYTSKTGLKVCLMLDDGKIVDSDLSNEDLQMVVKYLKNILLNLPDFKGGIFEVKDKTFIVFKIENGFVVSPTQSENVGSIYYNAERVLEEIEK